MVKKREKSYQKATNVTYTNQSNLRIEGLSFDGTNSDCLTLNNCNGVVISRCKFSSPNGNYKGIYCLNNTQNVCVLDCEFDGLQIGFYYGGATTIANFLQLVGCKFKNSRGAAPRRQQVQFLQIRGRGIKVLRSKFFSDENNPDLIQVDYVNIFSGGGVATDWVEVAYCDFVGTNMVNQADIPGGCALTDGDDTQYCWFHHLKGFRVGSYGVGHSAGFDTIIEDCVVLTDRINNRSNFPYIAYNWRDNGEAFCARIDVRNNKARWVKKDGTLENSIYLGTPGVSACANVVQTNNNLDDKTLNEWNVVRPDFMLCPNF